MASQKFILRKGKARDDGTAPLYLQIIAKRKVRRKSLGIWIKPKYWNEKKERVRRSHELHAAYNAKLHEWYLKAERARVKGGSADDIKRRIEGGSGTFDGYMEQYIDKLDRRDQYYEQKKFASLLRKLRKSFSSETIEWKDLTPVSLRRFEDYCREVRDNNPNTTRKELSRVRRVIRQAIKDGVLDAGRDPFARYDLPKGVQVTKRRLRESDIEAMEKLELEGSLELARDAFVFAFYANGMRFGDVCCLTPRKIVDGRVRYVMMKTDEAMSVLLSSKARAIVEKYTSEDRPFVFPFLRDGDDSGYARVRKAIGSANAIVNKSIKKVAELAGIANPDEIHFHVARHTFASKANRDGGIWATKNAMGHSSVAQTEAYLASVDHDATDELANKMWEMDDDE